MTLINWIVTLSNLSACRLLYSTWNTKVSPLVILVVLASTLMHASETKHSLPGICLVKHSNHLLWFDRIMAVTSGGYVAYLVFNNPRLIFKDHLLEKAVIGLLLNGVSELTNGMTFAITHSLWHALAFEVLRIAM